MIVDHCRSGQLQALIDGRLVPGEVVAVNAHLRECTHCRRELDALRWIDRSVREIPLVTVGPDFTQRVLRTLQIESTSPVAFRVLSYAAPAFAFTIVLGIVSLALLWAGVIGPVEVTRTQGVLGSALNTIGERAIGAAASLTDVLRTHIPPWFGKGVVGISFTVALVVCFLALVDLFLGRLGRR